MADEVPACDVLCEAMEYLSKLGSNLRARSENLKEKRIRKDKLKNSHAVHKAASKVLLICELSKKSLDNVETGVRRVLSLIDRVAASKSGAKLSNAKLTSTTETDCHYIVYQSRKLRIAKKVPLKHYMSVKVLAKKMSTSLQDKYPVYHDCKLYRHRRRALERKQSKDSREDSAKRKNLSLQSDTEQKSIGTENESPRNIKNGKDSPNITKHEKEIDLTKKKHNSSDETKHCKGNEVQVEKENKSKHKENLNSESEDVNSINRKNMNEDCDKIQILDKDDERQMDNTDSKKTKKESQKEQSKTSKDENKKSDKNKPSHSDDSSGKHKRFKSSNDKDLQRHDKYNEKKQVESKRKKFKNLIIPDDSSDDEEIEEKEVNKSSNKDNTVLILSDENESDSKKDSLKSAATHKELSKEDSEEPDKIITEKEKNNRIKSANCDKTVSTHSDKTVSENADKSMSDTELAEAENKDEKEDKDGIPLIRCVNISKLLKPDVINKAVFEPANKVTDIGKEKTEKNAQKQTDIDNDYVKRKENAKKYWAQKRKEVSAFKSKEFSIPVTRLPKFSLSFLQSHNLIRVTQCGAILCEIENEKAIEDIGKVKTALLNDSESDIELPSFGKPVKRTHLNSDKNMHDQNISKSKKDDHFDELNSNKCKSKNRPESGINDTEETTEITYSPTKIKHALLNDSDSDKNEEVNKVNGKEISSSIDPNKIKDSLLKDSDSEKDKEPDIDTKINEYNKGFTFNMKDFEDLERKVTEIIKSNLLNDSDSEKNGDEGNEKVATSENKDDEAHNSNKSENNDQNKSVATYNQKDVANQSAKNEDYEKEDSDTVLSPTKDPEKVKSALLNDSSDSEASHSKQKGKHKQHAEDSVNAKKKLLIHTSSSDAEHEHSDGSSDNIASKKPKRKQLKKTLQRSGSSSSTNEDEASNPRKKIKLDSKSPDRHSQGSVSGEVSNYKSKSSQSGMAESSDNKSKSSSRKMVRSKAKPSGSISQSSDNQDASDKDIDGLTNLNSLNKSHRRRDSTSTNATNNTQDSSSTKKRSRAKPSAIGEELLQPDSSSDGGSNDEIADSDIEDIPPVSLVGLNGGSIDTLAKDDLLDDTDSSGTQDKDKAEDSQNADDSDEDNNVKLKRRKPHAISSGSEAGSSRRKNPDDDVNISDFEDSEDSSETTKKSKRKKKASDSDGSGNSSDGGKKKRRRIKQLESDMSGSDTENEGRNKHGRKNIRKVMGKNQLEEATKKAAREEKERIARIAERQKVYNNLEFDESGKPDEVILEKVVLDFDPETKEPLIEVDRGLVKKLKPHQANGIKFMWDACFESVKRIKKDKGSGCILAHCMGLGKTLQVISLTHTLLIHGSLTGVRRVLVVCPLSTVLNWVNEVRMWLKHAETDFEVDVYELSRYKQNSERAFQLQQWFDHGGVCVLGYEMYRNLSADNTKKYKKKMLKSFQESLVDPGPDLVVCDEGHLLKNEKTSLSQSMNRVKTRRRIVLTGTPLQNNLKEYYCMVQFVKPNLLGKFNEYLNRFVNPITNGQYTDSTEHDIRVMKRRSHVLHKMLDGAVQRRDYGVLAPFLPPKHEYVLFITLSEVQVKLYQFYLDNYSRRPLPGKSSGFLFPDFQSLQRIWTHPLVLKYNSERYEIMQQKKREREEEDDSEGSLVNFIDDDSTPDESSTEESSDDFSDVSDDSRKKAKKKKASKKGKGKDTKASTRRGTRANPVELEEEEQVNDDVLEVKNENPTEWWIKLVADAELDDLRNSHKLVLLFDILRQCDTIGDKLLVFSQSLYSLDLIEHFLGKVDEATQEGRIDEKLGGHVGSWSPGVDYFRLDGSTSCENRSIWCKNFNREDNPRARLFLISTRAGGLGINLVAANRVVIFDVSWNPSHDVQSIFRVYRFGQKKPCYVYRFLAMGTMEEKIYERQVTKQAISKRVIDEQQIDRHYAENDLAELYKFEPEPPSPRPLPSLPKDRLFAEMLKEHEAQIYKYHEHDSLLENKEEETLSEEERKAAWEDFENEKNKPPPAAFNAWPMMPNGMVPGLVAQQQQQLAFAALAAMLRKDMPNINDNQIRDMIPLIYNSNPALMQKMGEIYKYAQPGMMNPGMMNPVMNPGGGGGMGGTSGLQYEPPWQRQHQQQQQLRLQQLLQQQNQMGAKFYAGGLGSRDPVAMALQQQRAREIMLGGGGGGAAQTAGAGAGAGRPRGRPPHAASLHAPLHAPAPLPAHHTNDVVNLDSD